MPLEHEEVIKGSHKNQGPFPYSNCADMYSGLDHPPVRTVGWSRRQAPVTAACGFDGNRPIVGGGGGSAGCRMQRALRIRSAHEEGIHIATNIE